MHDAANPSNRGEAAPVTREAEMIGFGGGSGGGGRARRIQGEVESFATRERTRRGASGRRRRREESKLRETTGRGRGSGGEEKGTLEGAGGGGFWSVTDEMDLVRGWSARAEWAGIGFLSRLGSRD